MTKSRLLAALSAAAITASAGAALAQDCADPIRIGILPSLSGTMAISETVLKAAMLMQIDQQNAAVGLPGCQIQALNVDPASDCPLFAEKARELLTISEVDVIFGA